MIKAIEVLKTQPKLLSNEFIGKGYVNYYRFLPILLNEFKIAKIRKIVIKDRLFSPEYYEVREYKINCVEVILINSTKILCTLDSFNLTNEEKEFLNG